MLFPEVDPLAASPHPLWSKAVLAEGSEPEGFVFLLPMVKKSQGAESTWLCGQAGVRSG